MGTIWYNITELEDGVQQEKICENELILTRYPEAQGEMFFSFIVAIHWGGRLVSTALLKWECPLK